MTRAGIVIQKKKEDVKLLTKAKESFNQDKLAYIIDNQEEYNQYIRYDNNANDWNPFLLPEKYLKKSKNCLVDVCYKYAKDKDDGRLYAVGSQSLQGFCREIRHSIADEYYKDLDIVNCHPVILSHLCVKYKINCELLDQYINNREKIIKEIIKSNNKISRDGVKTAILSLMNGGSGDYNKIKVKTPFLKKFNLEIQATLKRICEIEKDKYKVFVPKKDYNKVGGFVNRLLCVEENNILQCMIRFFKCEDDDNLVLCYDGIMLPIDKDYDLIGCEKYIKDTMNYSIKLKEKPMDEGLELPDDIPVFDPSTFNWSVDYTEAKKVLNGAFTDADISEYMFTLYGDDFILYLEYIYHWNGKYWTKDTSDDDIHLCISKKLFKHLKEVADKSYNTDNEDDLKIYQKILKKLIKIRNHNSKKGVVTEFMKLIKIKKDLFDLNPYLLGFTNGVYDLESMTFRETKKEDYISLIVGYDYKKSTDSEMETFMKFIVSVLPVPDEREFTLKAISSSLFGKTLENILILVGSGRNGKDTLISYLMKSALGEDLYYYNSCSVITDSSSSGVNQEKRNMEKKRCIVYSEPDKSKNLKGSVLKEISGGRSMNARGIYSTNTDRIIHCTNIILCNDIPKLDHVDKAMAMRLYVIPFRSQFLTQEQMDELPEGAEHIYPVDGSFKEDKWLEENKIHFLNLLLEYYKKFMDDRHKLRNAPNSIKELSKAYMCSSDDFLIWFNDAFEKTNNKDDYVKMVDLYESFRNSDLYSNMTKKEKRTMNRKQLTDDVSNNPNLKTHYRERVKYKGNITIRNCIIGYKTKANPRGFVDEDDDY